jgi:hypothetical protein
MNAKRAIAWSLHGKVKCECFEIGPNWSLVNISNSTILDINHHILPRLKDSIVLWLWPRSMLCTSQECVMSELRQHAKCFVCRWCFAFQHCSFSEQKEQVFSSPLTNISWDWILVWAECAHNIYLSLSFFFSILSLSYLVTFLREGIVLGYWSSQQFSSKSDHINYLTLLTINIYSTTILSLLTNWGKWKEVFSERVLTQRVYCQAQPKLQVKRSLAWRLR